MKLNNGIQRDNAQLAMALKVADNLADAAERMIETYKDHLDRCRPCTINWQRLRDAAATYHTALAAQGEWTHFKKGKMMNAKPAGQTPRTDAATWIAKIIGSPTKVVNVNFASQLERELASTSEQLDVATSLIARLSALGRLRVNEWTAEQERILKAADEFVARQRKEKV